MNYVWLDPLGRVYICNRIAKPVGWVKIDWFIVFCSDLENLHQDGELWGKKTKTCLIEFFNLLEKIAKSLEFDGVPKPWRRLEYCWRQRPGQLVMHKSVQEKKGVWVGRPPDRPTCVSMKRGNCLSTTRSTVQNEDFALHNYQSTAQSTAQNAEIEPAHLVVDRLTLLRCFLFGFWLHFWFDFRSFGIFFFVDSLVIYRGVFSPVIATL